VTTRGTIGEQIFEQVEQLTAQGAMNRLAAFKQVASASGRQVGTVAANYYRVARQRGATLQRRGAGKASTGRRGSGRILAVLRVLERLLVAQEEEIARLRKENARFAQLRRLLR
jgi:hypothetical protein